MMAHGTITTALQAAYPRNQASILKRRKRFISSPVHPDQLGAQPVSSYSMDTKESCPRGKMAGVST
jgi:hypothetical protein